MATIKTYKLNVVKNVDVKLVRINKLWQK